jgi:hypothetical protein
MEDNISDDLLDGADKIAQFLWNDRKKRRRVYYLHKLGVLPLTQWGAKLIGRKSTLRKFIAESERAALKSSDAA